MAKQQNTQATVNAQENVNAEAFNALLTQLEANALDATSLQAAIEAVQWTKEQRASIDAWVNGRKAQDVPTLQNAWLNVKQRDELAKELEVKHAQVASMASVLKFSEEQTKAYRETLGISETLEQDLQNLNVPKYLTEHLDSLNDPSVAVWSMHVAELAQVESMLEAVNALRSTYGQPEIFLAWQSTQTATTGRSRTVKGDNGSEAHDAASAKFMRVGVLHLQFDGFNIEWRADIENHTLTVTDKPHLTAKHAQGSIGLASAWRGFLNNVLLRTNTNDSLPARLLKHGYNKDNVYMYAAPTAETTAIKQPEKAQA